MSLSRYLSEVKGAIGSRDGEQLRALLRSDAALPIMQLAQRNANLPAAEITRMLAHPWSLLATSHF
eukprot:gene3458-13518_t